MARWACCGLRGASEAGLSLTIERGKIVRIEVIGDPAWLREAELGVLE